MGVVIFSCKGREDRLLKCAHPVIFTTAPDPTASWIERRPLPCRVALLRHLYSRDMRKPLPRVFFSIKSHIYTSNSPPLPPSMSPLCFRFNAHVPSSGGALPLRYASQRTNASIGNERRSRLAMSLSHAAREAVALLKNPPPNPSLEGRQTCKVNSAAIFLHASDAPWPLRCSRRPPRSPGPPPADLAGHG